VDLISRYINSNLTQSFSWTLLQSQGQDSVMELATEHCIQGHRDSKWPQKEITVQSTRAATAALMTCGHPTAKLLMRLHRSASLTLSLLTSYIYGAPCKARNFNVVYKWTYVWQRWKPSLSICCTMFQHWINAESFPVSQLCVNTLLATQVTLITDGI
jgi:hypothetical protein